MCSALKYLRSIMNICIVYTHKMAVWPLRVPGESWAFRRSISPIGAASRRGLITRFAGNDRLSQLAGGHVPEFHRLVSAAGGEGIAVG